MKENRWHLNFNLIIDTMLSTSQKIMIYEHLLQAAVQGRILKYLSLTQKQLNSIINLGDDAININGGRATVS